MNNKQSEHMQGVLINLNPDSIVNKNSINFQNGACDCSCEKKSPTSGIFASFANNVTCDKKLIYRRPALHFDNAIHPLYVGIGTIISGEMLFNIASFQISKTNYQDTVITVECVLDTNRNRPVSDDIASSFSPLKSQSTVSEDTAAPLKTQPPIFIRSQFTAGDSLPTVYKMENIISHAQTMVNKPVKINKIYIDSISNPVLNNILNSKGTEPFSFSTSDNMDKNGSTFNMYIFLVILVIVLFISIYFNNKN
jgi:hypothetical protein